MNEQKLIYESQKLIEAAMELKEMLSKHKNFLKWETHYADDKPLLTGGKTIDYRVSMKIEQVIFNHDKTEVKHVVPPRLKNHIN